MPKDYFQDITPPHSSHNATSNEPSSHERTIRNIPIAQRRERGARDPDVQAPIKPPPPIRPNTPSRFEPGKNKMYIWIGAGAAVLLLGIFLMMSMFRSTSVVVTPRTHQFVLTEDVGLSAYPANSEQAAVGALSYDVFEKTYDSETSVKANGFSEVEEYASGVVTVYNEYSAAPVRLIKNTRFEGPGGLIFRVRDSVVVPGKKSSGPGTLTATIYADEPGEKYNISPADRFTIPGLKGGDMYDTVYARSSVTFKGGFIGSKPKIADADLKAAQAKLRTEIEQKARAEITTVSVPGKLIFPQLMNITFESMPSGQGEGGGALVRERAIVKLPIFPETLFAKVVAVAVRTDVADAEVRLSKTEGLEIRSISSAGAPVYGSDAIDFLVSGNGTLVWNVDTNALGEALKGKTKSSFQNVITTFPSIEKADAFIRPFWRSTFPSDSVDISFVVSEVK